MNKKVVIFTAPSGSGKSTIVQEILKDRFFGLSISATTRDARNYEIDGKHYHFLSIDDFKYKIDNNEFVEYEEVYENQFYGTLKKQLEEIWAENKIVLFDVDVKGAITLKEYFGDNALSVFIKVPSMDVLIKRLHSRGTETDESLRKRVDKFESELQYMNRFDYILINDELNNTINNIRTKIGHWI